MLPRVSLEIRAARPDEMQEFATLTSYAFAAPPPSDKEAPPQTLAPEWTTCGFVDGRLAVTTGAYPFKMRLNGAGVGVAGLTAVASYPEFRRQGNLRRVIQHGLAEQRERGQSIAILWASFGGIYQRFGYGLASSQIQYRFDPRLVPFREELPVTGSVGLVPKDDAAGLLGPVYKEFSAPRNLMLQRAPLYWQTGVLNWQPGKPIYTALYRNGAGEAGGYLVYTTQSLETDEPGPNQIMNVRDLLALDPEAFRALWAYIRRHDLVREVRMQAAPDDLAPDLLLEPSQLRRRVSDGIWLRVVDVARALPQRPYGEAGALHFEVVDELCDWNAGCFLLETDGASSEVKRSEGRPDLVLPVRTLASLVSGHASASQLMRAGLLQAGDASAVEMADRLFATRYPPFCPDGF